MREEDVDVFLAIRRAIDAEHMPTRANYLEHIKAPGRVDLIAELAGEPVAAAFVERHNENVDDVEWLHLRGPLLDAETT